MTTATSDGDDPIEQLDTMLVKHPFGNNDYITRQMHSCFRRRLVKLSSAIPAAGRLEARLSVAGPEQRYLILGDTVVRCAINKALPQVHFRSALPEVAGAAGQPYVLSLGECERIFDQAASRLEHGPCAPLGTGLATRIEPGPDRAWIWSNERPDDVFSDAFTRLVKENYGGLPSTPTASEVNALRRGTQLLSDLLPNLSRSVLPHTHLVVTFSPDEGWSSTTSSSEFRLGGTIFMSRRILHSPWVVAEFLFHESLHQQLYDCRHGHTILQPDFTRPGAPTVLSPWNSPGSSRQNVWDVHRALAAFHVYVHLSLLATVADRRADELAAVYRRQTAEWAMTPARAALDRAHYLGEQLRTTCWAELGQAGRQLVEWLGVVLGILDPCPPPPGSQVHLLLYRYIREASSVEDRLSRADGPTDLSHRTAELAMAEVEAVRKMLATMNLQTELNGFNKKLALVLDPKRPVIVSGVRRSGSQFWRVRSHIYRTLTTAAWDRCRLSATGNADELATQMVESSSKVLADLLGR